VLPGRPTRVRAHLQHPRRKARRVDTLLEPREHLLHGVSLPYRLHCYLKNRTSLAVGLYTVNPSYTRILPNLNYSPIFYEICHTCVSNIEQYDCYLFLGTARNALLQTNCCYNECPSRWHTLSRLHCMEIILPMALILSNLYNYIFPVIYCNNENVNTSYITRWRNRLEGTATIMLYNSPKIYFQYFTN